MFSVFARGLRRLRGVDEESLGRRSTGLGGSLGHIGG